MKAKTKTKRARPLKAARFNNRRRKQSKSQAKKKARRRAVIKKEHDGVFQVAADTMYEPGLAEETAEEAVVRVDVADNDEAFLKQVEEFNDEGKPLDGTVPPVDDPTPNKDQHAHDQQAN